MDEYFCPKCGAILNNQAGFSPDCGAWTCLECGEMLMDDEVYNGDEYEGVAWFCDFCGVLLNKQDGFSDSYGSWTCTECGHNNGTTEDDIINNDDRHECPNCGSLLNEQFGFCGYEDDWVCTECGNHLHRDYSFDEFSIKEEDEENDDYYSKEDDYEENDDDVEKFECPNCCALLNEQDDFDNEDEYWKCEECGELLYHEYSSEPFYIKEDIEFEEDDEDLNEINENVSKSTNNVENDTSSKNIKPKEEQNNSLIEKFKKIVSGIFNGKRIKVGINSADLIGNNVNEVVRALKETGFTNVGKQAIQDIYVDNIKEVGEVERVIIDEKIEFNKKDEFPYDSKILILYHTKKKLEFPFSSNQVHKKNYKELIKLLKDLGFTNIETEEIKDLVTGWLVKDGSIEQVSINNQTLYKAGIVCKYDAEIVIKYHTFAKKR